MRKGFSFLISVLFILFLGGCATNESGKTALDVVALRGKTPNEVVDISGDPDSSYIHYVLGRPFLVYRYDPHQVEMRFYQNKLVEIIVHDPRPWPFEPETIEHFGLDYFEPTTYNPDANISWSNYGGLLGGEFLPRRKKAWRFHPGQLRDLLQ